MRDIYSGRVTAFDDHRGRGEVQAGGLTYPFHCTAIADGSRTIPEDARVDFTLVVGPLGALEARAVRTQPGLGE
jgi:cold shock CspA family protein